MRVAAFFDVDRTVLEVNSGRLWLQHLWTTGHITPFRLARALVWLAEYKAGLLDYDKMVLRVLQWYRGMEVSWLRREVRGWFEREIAPTVCTQALRRIEAHRETGHVIALLTSSTVYLCEPLGNLLGIEHLLCTRVGETGGVLSGELMAPTCFGDGKVTLAEGFAREHDISLEDSYFYSDSYTDVPMLQRVGHPQVINPDPRLLRLARARGWPLERWHAVRKEVRP